MLNKLLFFDNESLSQITWFCVAESEDRVFFMVKSINNICEKLKFFSFLVVFDSTQSIQSLGGNGVLTAWMRYMIPILSSVDLAAGCDSFFMELYIDGKIAKYDGAN